MMAVPVSITMMSYRAANILAMIGETMSNVLSDYCQLWGVAPWMNQNYPAKHAPTAHLAGPESANLKNVRTVDGIPLGQSQRLRLARGELLGSRDSVQGKVIM